jgi:hypothetical protein
LKRERNGIKEDEEGSIKSKPKPSPSTDREIPYSLTTDPHVAPVYPVLSPEEEARVDQLLMEEAEKDPSIVQFALREEDYNKISEIDR